MNVKRDPSHLFALDLRILKTAILSDKQFNMGIVVACCLHNNALVGDFFGGIYAARLAAHLGVPIKENDNMLPPSSLDYDAMVCHQFLERDDPPLRYKIIFNRRHVFPITLPTPSLFNFQEKRRHLILEEEAEDTRGR